MKKEIKESQIFPAGFSWETTFNSSRKHNPKIKEKKGVIVYSREDYAEDLYKMYSGVLSDSFIASKDLVDGNYYECKIESVNENGAIASTISGQSVFIDISKERKDCKRLNLEGSNYTPGNTVKLVVRKTGNGVYYGSAVDYFVESLRAELHSQIKSEKNAYLVKIESVNRGGYIADLSGIKCFLPGSLAAANKITDFDTYIGKEIYVMVEGYIEQKDMFVVSYKKYIEKIMDQKIQELDLTKKYTGYVTGTSEFGVFVEWEDVYTGLLHRTEAGENTDLSRFNPGDEIEFYVKEVKENNRLTLTFSEPLEKTVKLYKIEEAINSGEKIVVEATIKHRRKNGSLIEIQDLDSMAFIPQFKMGENEKNLKTGDTLDVLIYEVDVLGGKIFASPV